MKDLISTYVNNISTSPSEVETEDQPGPSSRSNLWFDKRLECPICFKKFNFNDIESHASNCASKFDCNEIEVTYEESTNEQLGVTIPLWTKGWFYWKWPYKRRYKGCKSKVIN